MSLTEDYGKYLELLCQVALFKDISPKDLGKMIVCLAAKTVAVSKSGFVLNAGDKPEHIGVVLDGRFYVVRESADGIRSLLTTLSPGDFFAEALCCAGVKASPVGVTTDTGGTVMLIEFQRILRNCPSSCTFHTKLIENMVAVLARKNLMLQSRMELLSNKSIRTRLMAYLESASDASGRDFTIPFNREQLADFLCIDRSALSRELSRLKADGVIDYWKNKFRLL